MQQRPRRWHLDAHGLNVRHQICGEVLLRRQSKEEWKKCANAESRELYCIVNPNR